MAVQHDRGTPAVQQGTEAFEAPVGDVVLVPEAADRRMRQQDIEPAGRPKAPAELPDPGGHFFFRIHMDGVRTVAQGTAQAEDPDAFDPHNLPVGAQAAFGRLAVVPVVVVAVDINDRRVGEAGDKGQVFRGKVARGKDHVHSLERRAAAFSPEPGRRFIGNGHNPHRGKLTFCSS